MADDITPGEASVLRGGAQLNLREARALADEAGTVRGQAPTSTADRDVLDPSSTADLRAADGASGGTGNQQRGERPPDDHPFVDSETALGGADTVQKTTWGVGHGTEPVGTQEYAPVGHDLKKGDKGPVVARVASGGGLSPIALVLIVLGALAGLVYAFGVFR